MGWEGRMELGSGKGERWPFQNDGLKPPMDLHFTRSDNTRLQRELAQYTSQWAVIQ